MNAKKIFKLHSSNSNTNVSINNDKFKVTGRLYIIYFVVTINNTEYLYTNIAIYGYSSLFMHTISNGNYGYIRFSVTSTGTVSYSQCYINGSWVTPTKYSITIFM